MREVYGLLWRYDYVKLLIKQTTSGLNPNCLFYHRDLCALQRFHEILKENGNNGAEALVNVFTDKELRDMWGKYAGRTSATRLEWVLQVTLGDSNPIKSAVVVSSTLIPYPPLAIHLQFGTLFPSNCSVDPIDESCGCGILMDFEDSRFYGADKVWGGDDVAISPQINHFLSGVGEYYYGKDLRTIIAHEKSSDADEWTNFTNEVTPEDYSHFYRAWHFDTNGMYSERDKELWAILAFRPGIAFGDVDPARRGNSLQDLRLSLKAVRFANWVMSNPSSNPSQAGSWLQNNLLP